MGKSRINGKVLQKLVILREQGQSINEIVKKLHLGTGTVSKYCKDIPLSKKAKAILEEKKYPAKKISSEQKEKALLHAKAIVNNLNSRDIFLIFSSLYWGEGTKAELNIINGDPKLIRFFVRGLLSLGVNKGKIKVSIRYYSGQNKQDLVRFWVKFLALKESNVVGFEKVNADRKIHKLPYGMCRVRMEKSSYYHKLVNSAIEIISSGSSIG